MKTVKLKYRSSLLEISNEQLWFKNIGFNISLQKLLSVTSLFRHGTLLLIHTPSLPLVSSLPCLTHTHNNSIYVMGRSVCSEGRWLVEQEVDGGVRWGGAATPQGQITHPGRQERCLQWGSSQCERICCGFLSRLVSRYFRSDDQKSLSREGYSLHDSLEFTFLTEQTCLNISFWRTES